MPFVDKTLSERGGKSLRSLREMKSRKGFQAKNLYYLGVLYD